MFNSNLDTDIKIILEDGQEFYGHSFGARTEKLLELVFNTSVIGYQEILSDLSYTGQAVILTYPLIGNYGMNDSDYECENPAIGALIVREYNNEPSNFRSTATLDDVMKKFNITGVSGVDTRKLTRIIRNFGSCKALITSADTPLNECLEKLSGFDFPKDTVSKVSTKKIFEIYPERELFNVVAIDCGIKFNILRSLVKKNCRVTVVPYGTPSQVITALKPDGIFISNGPGDPNDIPETIETVKNFIGLCPVFGICLGHQIISLAYGAKTYKLKFGHHGANHPVKNLTTGKIEITSQNHSYAVDIESLKNTPLKITHVNLLDKTVEGVECVQDKIFSVQYHPESAPGPNDSGYLFDKFIEIMRGNKFHYA